MNARQLSDFLKAGDRVAVSNITGREASKVTLASQKFCGNIVGGWALGKGGEQLGAPGGASIPVFATIADLMAALTPERRPNKVIVYSPPSAVYGEVKEIIANSNGCIETLFIITEHVSIEVTSKIAHLCRQAGIDVLGCNTLGMINAHDGVRVGAVGADTPADSFRPGSTTIISNSGNMVNTMASYLQCAGFGTSYGVSTGKDMLILQPLKKLLPMACRDERTKMIVLYIEPGGIYEKEAIEEVLSRGLCDKPIIAYITGAKLERRDLSLGHAGAVVEGAGTSASEKMKMFDDYFGIAPFTPGAKYKGKKNLAECLQKGIRITSLHHLPGAASLIADSLKIKKDFRPSKPLSLSPWFVDYKSFGKNLPSRLVLHRSAIPEPYASQVKMLTTETLGANLARRDMKNASHASSNDGRVSRLYGHSVEQQMRQGAFASSLFLGWTGLQPQPFEAELLEKCLIASLTNGPGTISAQGAKLSASAGNAPNTAMIAALACIGEVHGGNGKRAVRFLIDAFRKVDLTDPYSSQQPFELDEVVEHAAQAFNKARRAAKEAGTDYERIPCLGHPVFRNEPVNVDPREQVISDYLKQEGRYNIFLDFYHRLAARIKTLGVARNVWAVNLDGAIASVVLACCYPALTQRQLTIHRVCDIAFMVFAMGRAGGAGGEFLDHQDYGLPMDMRIPVSECAALSKAQD